MSGVTVAFSAATKLLFYDLVWRKGGGFMSGIGKEKIMGCDVLLI